MSTEVIRYRNRRTGNVETESVFAESALRFLYGNPLGRAVVWLILKRTIISHLYGWLQSSPRSRRKIPGFVARLGIDATEADRPLVDYQDLNDFFTRRLRPECRPIDTNPDILVSPADGRTLVLPGIRPDVPLRIKNSQVTLSALLQDERAAARYAGGTALVFRLAPADYHRFHFPDSGVASPSREVGHGLHSVHTIALLGGAPCFRNQRMISFLDSRIFGRIAVVEVGAMLVGGIRQTYSPGTVERGQEQGYFCFGASTVILVIEMGRLNVDEDLLRDSASGLETLVHMGTRIGTRR